MSGTNQHRARYKNAALDSQEMRRRREEEGIQLRKQKREQQLFKKRNVHADESLQVPLVETLPAMGSEPMNVCPVFFPRAFTFLT